MAEKEKDGEEKKVKIIKPFKDSEQVYIGEKPGYMRKVFRCINEELTGSKKFKVGVPVFAPGEGGPVHVHENAEEFSYIIQGGGVQLDKDGNVCGHYEKGDIKFVPAGAYHGGYCDSDEPLVMLWAYSEGGELPDK